MLMKHSIKPFFLDAILAWAKANSCTCILIVKQFDKNILPPSLQEYGQVAFNVSDKAIVHRKITTEGVSFSTHIAHNAHMNDIFLSVGGWKQVKIKETGDVFDLNFDESLTSHQANEAYDLFPKGIFLHKNSKGGKVEPQPFDTTLAQDVAFLQDQEQDLFETADRSTGKKPLPFLKLVVNNDK